LIIARVAAVVEAPFEHGEIGVPDLFRHACLGWRAGVEAQRSAVSSRPVAALGQGEEPQAPVFSRVMDQFG
jgi:hypothetical protein